MILDPDRGDTDVYSRWSYNWMLYKCCIIFIINNTICLKTLWAYKFQRVHKKVCTQI